MEQHGTEAALLPNIANQMRSLLSNLYLAASQVIPPEQREQDPALDAKAAILEQSFFRLLRLVNSMSAAEYLSDSQTLSLRDADLVKLVSEVCESSADLAEQLGIQLKFVCAMDRRVCAIHPAAGRHLLCRGADRSKDQSYFLCRLTQEQLSRTLFPLGNLEKPAVRALAEAHGLINAQKRDSQDICFVPDGDYVGFITRCVGHESPTGPFVDQEGRVLGQHKGFIRYTKGQHKGLDLAIEPPLYVLRKDPADHAVYLGHNEDLFTSELIAGDWNWISIPALTAPMTVTVKTRYSQREAEAVAEPLSGGQVRLRFREPQRAVTPGQFVVLYDGDAVVGGGVILE